MPRATSCLIFEVNLPADLTPDNTAGSAFKWVLGAAAVMAAALGVGRFAYTPLLPDMVAQFGWSFGQAGDVASANFVGYLVGALLAPAVAGSRWLRVIIAASLMASVATTALGAVTTGYLPWLLLRFAAGVASAYCLVLVTTQLLQKLDQYGSSRLGNLHFSGVGLGILLCLVVLQQVTQGNHVAAAWQQLGSATALLMLVAWLCISRDITPAPVLPAAQVSAQLSKPLWKLIIGYGFFGFGYVVSATFVVAMAQQLLSSGGLDNHNLIRQLDNPEMVVWWIVGITIIPSVYVWQMAANRWGLMGTLRVAYLVEAVGALLAGFSSDMLQLGIACVLLGGTFAAITALGISAAKAQAGSSVALAVSAMTVSFAIGQLVGPALSGRIADITGSFFWPSLIAGVLLAVAGLLVGRNQTGTQICGQ